MEHTNQLALLPQLFEPALTLEPDAFAAPPTELPALDFSPARPHSSVDSNNTDSAALGYGDISLMFRYTRRWIHYGMLAHILICTLIAAMEGVVFRLFGFH